MNDSNPINKSFLTLLTILVLSPEVLSILDNILAVFINVAIIDSIVATVSLLLELSGIILVLVKFREHKDFAGLFLFYFVSSGIVGILSLYTFGL